MDWLKGKKTQIVAVLMVVIGALDMITTDLSFDGVLAFLMSDQVRMMLEGFGLSFLRLGVAKAGK